MPGQVRYAARLCASRESRYATPLKILVCFRAGNCAYRAYRIAGCNPAKRPEHRELRFDPALMRAPPKVAEASIEFLVKPTEAGNVRLRARFEEKVAKQALVIQGGKGPTLLRDDGVGADEKAGDGVFSAFVNFDTRAYEAELKRRAEVAKKVKEVPVFKNRAFVGWKQMEMPRAMRFVPGEIVPLFAFDGDSSVVDPYRELLITDVSVVDDPTRTYNPCNDTGTKMGAWTFGKLMTEMANEDRTGINASDLPCTGCSSGKPIW